MIRRLLFSGHMIDFPDRKTPRFPANHENWVRNALEKVIQDVASSHTCHGISSAAAGGDLLFLELCHTYQIPCEIYLPYPPDIFREESVDYAGGDWPERFDQALQRSKVSVMQNISSKRNIYSLTNERMIEEAMKSPANEILLVTVWNGKKGDGGGGTWEMAEACSQLGIKAKHIKP